MGLSLGLRGRETMSVVVEKGPPVVGGGTRGTKVGSGTVVGLPGIILSLVSSRERTTLGSE